MKFSLKQKTLSKKADEIFRELGSLTEEAHLWVSHRITLLSGRQFSSSARSTHSTTLEEQVLEVRKAIINGETQNSRICRDLPLCRV